MYPSYSMCLVTSVLCTLVLGATCYVSIAAPSGCVSSSRPCWTPAGIRGLWQACWQSGTAPSAAVCRQRQHYPHQPTSPPTHQQRQQHQHPDPVFNPWQQAAPARFRNEMQCSPPHKAHLRLRLRLRPDFVRSTQYQRAWPSMLLTHLISFPRANPALGAGKKSMRPATTAHTPSPASLALPVQSRPVPPCPI